jgi:hypothetical protein
MWFESKWKAKTTMDQWAISFESMKRVNWAAVGSSGGGGLKTVPAAGRTLGNGVRPNGGCRILPHLAYHFVISPHATLDMFPVCRRRLEFIGGSSTGRTRTIAYARINANFSDSIPSR